MVAQRAEDRIGDVVEVLVERVDDDSAEGRAAHQGPEVDGTTTLQPANGLRTGEFVSARVVAADGADLIAEPLAVPARRAADSMEVPETAP